MSHFVNDRIADQAIDMVADMSDAQVKSALLDKVGCSWPSDMNRLRDILVQNIFDDLMSRPGPHG